MMPELGLKHHGVAMRGASAEARPGIVPITLGDGLIPFNRSPPGRIRWRTGRRRSALGTGSGEGYRLGAAANIDSQRRALRPGRHRLEHDGDRASRADSN
jgi:hypothetical protein